MQSLRRLLAIAREAVEGRFDQFAFHLGQRQAGECVGLFLGDLARREPGFDHRGVQLGAPVEGARSFDDVLEFANVAGPVVLLQQMQRIDRQRTRRLAFASRDATQEVLGQRRDVVLARTERGKFEAALADRGV